MSRLSRAFRPVQVEGARRVRVYNNIAGGATAISEGDGLVIAAGVVSKVADANTVGIHGIACADIAIAGTGEMWIEGVFEGVVAGTVNFAQGGGVYSAASQEVDDGAQGDVALGYVVGSDPANGATVVEFVLHSQFMNSLTHA